MPSGICQDPGGFAPVVRMYKVRTLALARHQKETLSKPSQRHGLERKIRSTNPDLQPWKPKIEKK
jgi:hypothetical protein